MARRDEYAEHERLLQLLAERVRADPVRRAQLDTEIAPVAARLGLGPEELESITPQLVEAARRPPDLIGRFRIYRRARAVLPFVFGLMLAAIVAAMGQPLVAAAGVSVLVVAWVLRSRRWVIRFEVDALGRMDFGRHGTVSWSAVDEVSFRYRHPWLVPRATLEHVAGTTAAMRIIMRDGRTVRLAQGQLFQIRPNRQPVSLDRLSRFLRRQASGAGLRVERTGDGNWCAKRPPG